MSQLVDQTCVQCREKITSHLDGEFCWGCGLPVHHACRRPPEVADKVDVCAICGAACGDEATVRRRLEGVSGSEKEWAEDSHYPGEPQRPAGTSQQIIAGFICLVIGVIITIFSLQSTTIHRGTIIVMGGLMLFGISLIVRGFAGDRNEY